MKAFVLAAGLGTRLKPLTDTVPKPLVPVEGKPLVGHTLRFLASFGITEVRMNVFHHAQQVMQVLGEGHAYGVHLSYSVESTLLGTGGGLQKAAEWFGDEPFVVINSDIVSSINLDQALAAHEKTKALCTMVLRKSTSSEEPASIETDDSMRVVGILGHRLPHAQVEGTWMFTGVHVLHPRVLQYLPLEAPSCIIRQGYVPALLAGEPIHAVQDAHYWADAGTWDAYRRVCEDVKNGIINGW